MKFIPVFGPMRLVYKLDFSVPPRPPTEEERQRMRRMAEAYDEAETRARSQARVPVASSRALLAAHTTRRIQPQLISS